jgi:DNA (cytosine-5)-methyltransferase 1
MDRLTPILRSRLMAKVRGRDTAPELVVRRLAHRLGLRFRLHRQDLPGTPDISTSDIRSRMLLAPAFRVPTGIDAGDQRRILDAKIRTQRRARRRCLSFARRRRMAAGNHLGVRTKDRGGLEEQTFAGDCRRDRCRLGTDFGPDWQQSIGKATRQFFKSEAIESIAYCKSEANMNRIVDADDSARRSRNQRALNCVDLFAGAGGFSLAAREAGFRLRLAIENDKHAISTYRGNLCSGRNSPLLLEGDISLMSSMEARDRAFSGNEKCDLLLGGPPCQGFSSHRINDAGVSDKRNDLIHTYFDYVRTFLPSVFLMENVPGMLWPRHVASLDRFYLEGTQAGYDVVEPIVIDARDYGVPQRRKRVFILGLRTGVSAVDLMWPPPPTHGSEAARTTDPELLPWRSCASVFVGAPRDDPNDVHMKHNAELIEAFRRTPRNGGSRKASGRTLDCHAEHDGHNDVYGRIDPSQPAPTMTTACINPSKGRFVHPSQHHGITVRQAARIQTFPDDFVFAGGLMASGEQVGNAVPVALAKQLINHLKPLILRAREAAVTKNESREQEAA